MKYVVEFVYVTHDDTAPPQIMDVFVFEAASTEAATALGDRLAPHVLQSFVESLDRELDVKVDSWSLMVAAVPQWNKIRGELGLALALQVAELEKEEAEDQKALEASDITRPDVDDVPVTVGDLYNQEDIIVEDGVGP